MMESRYPLNTGDDPLYGEFHDCRILGDPCTIRVQRLEDGDARALDILGIPSFRRGQLAIHVSGLDDRGKRSGGQPIRGIGMMECLWDRPGRHPSGTGCNGPEPVVMLDNGEPGHFAYWTRARGFITVAGIADRIKHRLLSARGIVELTDVNGPKHVAAVRRLLEDAENVLHNGYYITKIDHGRNRGRYKVVPA